MFKNYVLGDNTTECNTKSKRSQSKSNINPENLSNSTFTEKGKLTPYLLLYYYSIFMAFLWKKTKTKTKTPTT